MWNFSHFQENPTPGRLNNLASDFEASNSDEDGLSAGPTDRNKQNETCSGLGVNVNSIPTNTVDSPEQEDTSEAHVSSQKKVYFSEENDISTTNSINNDNWDIGFVVRWDGDITIFISIFTYILCFMLYKQLFWLCMILVLQVNILAMNSLNYMGKYILITSLYQ